MLETDFIQICCCQWPRFPRSKEFPLTTRKIILTAGQFLLMLGADFPFASQIRNPMSTTSSANFRNPARYIEARQREHPPIYQSAAGWQGLFGGALTFVAPIMQARTRRGMIGGGEVGELTPVASVTEVGSGYAIEMHSGLMRLIYSAARAFLAGDDGHLAGIEPTAALSVVQIAEKIADLFENYEVHQIATAQIFPVTEVQRDWANIITIHAETFLLMHELAHIYNEHSFWRFFGKKKANEYEREIQADSMVD